MKYCAICGAQLNDDARFCGKCGADIESFDNKLFLSNSDSEDIVASPKKDKCVKANNKLIIAIFVVAAIICGLCFIWLNSPTQRLIRVISKDDYRTALYLIEENNMDTESKTLERKLNSKIENLKEQYISGEIEYIVVRSKFDMIEQLGVVGISDQLKQARDEIFEVYCIVEGIPSINEICDSTNNAQTYESIAIDGEWIYYEHNSYGLCKTKLDESAETWIYYEDENWDFSTIQLKENVELPEEMNRIRVDELIFLGDSLYFEDTFDYCKVDVDNNKIMELGFSAHSDCFTVDGINYFVQDPFGVGNYDVGGIYAVDVLNRNYVRMVAEMDASDIYMHDEYIFFEYGYNQEEKHGFWRVDKDGGNIVQLLSYCPDYVNIAEDYILYIYDDQIYTMDLDGTNQSIVDDERLSGFGYEDIKISGDNIFYIDSYSHTIYRMDKDGHNCVELSSVPSSHILVWEDWIYYTSEKLDSIYKMKLDGSLNQKII